MFYRVIENTQRKGMPVYRLVKTYKRYAALQKWLDKTGQPVWVLATRDNELIVYGATLGGHSASYWNTGGWGFGYMPILRFWSGK